MKVSAMAIGLCLCATAESTSRSRRFTSKTLSAPIHPHNLWAVRGGGTPPPPPSESLARGGSSNEGVVSEGGEEKKGFWNPSNVKKVLIALGAFAAQQTLTRMADSGRFPLLKGKQQSSSNLLLEGSGEDPLLQLEDPDSPAGLLEAAMPSSAKDQLIQATIPEHIFNMVKGIVGVGVLSLPAGIAAFGSARSAILPAMVLVTIMGILSAIGFSWTGQVCAALVEDCKESIATPTYRQTWSYSVSQKTSWIPAVSTTAMTFIACLCFSMVLADSLTDLVKPLVSKAGRSSVLWGVSGLVLFPLCWMKNLKSLAPFSLLGVLGMAYTGLAMAGRFLAGSYEKGAPLLNDIPVSMRPAFGTDGWKAVFKPGSIILVSMLSTAYMCHYNAPKFYNELKDNTIPRFNKVVAAGYGISILMTGFIACVGFATFGSNSNGFVLNNYANNDVWMSLSRVAVAVALTFSYPLCFQGLREGVLDVAKIPPRERTEKHLNTATVGLLLALTALATVLKDVSIVLALTGATLGNLLCYIFPAIMYGRVNPSVKLPAILLGVTGVVLGVIGIKLAVESM